MNPVWLTQAANHLWQSTLFAGIAGLLTLALRRNQARVRHAVWLAASAKFLIPCSVLIAMGGQFQWRTAPQTTPSGFGAVMYVAMDEVGRPFTAPPVFSRQLPGATPAVTPLPAILACIWVCGFFGIVCSWWIRWRRIRASVRAGSPVNMELPIAALSSPTLLEPGVFGIFRPVLLLPEGIFDRLTRAQLQAVVAHELCHVRNRDNLTAAIHMFVETVFWFHPLVWWIGKRMVEERERACDEEVLRVFTDPRTYADAILSICRLYTESPLACTSGISGASLRKRIEAIMIHRKLRPLNLARKVVLCAAGFMAVAIPIAVGIVNAPAIRAQTRSESHQQFEVASIKPSKDCGLALGAPPAPSGSAKKTGNGSAAAASPGRMNACGTLEQLIRRAYLAPNPGAYGNAVPIEGGPGWIRSESALYQIVAKPNGPATQAMMHGPMMQALLEDRFKLKIRRETREGPAYALTVAPGGSKLTKFLEGSCTPYTFPPPTLAAGKEFCAESQGRNGTEATVYRQAIDLDTFATFLFVLTDRPVINRTGLTGRFDIRLEYTPDETTPVVARRFADAGRGDPVVPAPTASDPAGGVSIFTALQEQLGLKLEAAKGPRDYLVIEHIERPSAN